MQSNPLDFLDEKYLPYLKLYIWGYESMASELDEKYESLLDGFYEYVVAHYEVETDGHWDDIIRSFSCSEQQAFDNFFVLLDGFLGSYRGRKKNIPFSETEVSVEPITNTIYESRVIREIHYTNHGNPRCFQTPHEHEVGWDENGISYLITQKTQQNTFSERSIVMAAKKGLREKFDDLEEFVSNLKRGGEIEFEYEGDHYSITQPEGKIYFIKMGDGKPDLEHIVENIDELLECNVNNIVLKEAVGKLTVLFRCF